MAPLRKSSARPQTNCSGERSDLRQGPTDGSLLPVSRLYRHWVCSGYVDRCGGKRQVVCVCDFVRHRRRTGGYAGSSSRVIRKAAAGFRRHHVGVDIPYPKLIDFALLGNRTCGVRPDSIRGHARIEKPSLGVGRSPRSQDRLRFGLMPEPIPMRGLAVDLLGSEHML